MNNHPLILSLFPGIDLLGLAFQQEWPELCIVRGPDPIFNSLQDIRNFHVPAGMWYGIIGGPPCTGESNLAHLNGTPGYSMADEFMRIVHEATPDWWVLEAVIRHPAPYVAKLSPRYLGEKQSRKRYFHSNLNILPYIEVSLFENPEYKYAVLAGHGPIKVQSGRAFIKYTWCEMLELQGLPNDFKLPAFTVQEARKAVGNGVPLPLGRAVARAIRKALEANK